MTKRINGFIHISEAAEIVVDKAAATFRTKQEHATKETSREGAPTPDPALTETTYEGGS